MAERGTPLTWTEYRRLPRPDQVVVGLMNVLPLLAAVTVAWVIAGWIMVVMKYPWWLAGLIGVALSLGILIFLMTTQKLDGTDLLVGPVLIIVLSVVLVPVFKQAREQNLRRQQRQQQLQQRQHILSPPAPRPRVE
jgi:hypothetical protein